MANELRVAQLALDVFVFAVVLVVLQPVAIQAALVITRPRAYFADEGRFAVVPRVDVQVKAGFTIKSFTAKRTERTVQLHVPFLMRYQRRFSCESFLAKLALEEIPVGVVRFLVSVELAFSFEFLRTVLAFEGKRIRMR